jgi:hypothetical protein
MAAEECPVVGTCHRCGEPVEAGDEKRVTIHQGTGAAPEVLLHIWACQPRLQPRTWT